MESKQKYIEEEFELDEFFISQIHNFKHGASVAIADKIDRMKGLPSTKGRIRNIAGHVNDSRGNPVFFLVDYFKEDEYAPIVLVDIRKTHVDKYLDYINLKRYIK
jgi:hypothetical protein|tara:strand:+ start:765 stop:1079 length:315 start_codon:yes stop_codon:yes gene_type:complete